MIEAEKYYTITEICELDPILQKRGKFWLLSKIREGRFEVKNTAMGMKRPAYLIKGRTVKTYIDSL